MLSSSLIDESVQKISHSEEDIKSVDSQVVEEVTSKFLGDYYGVVEQ